MMNENWDIYMLQMKRNVGLRMKLVDFLYVLNKIIVVRIVLFIVIVNTGYILKSINELK